MNDINILIIKNGRCRTYVPDIINRISDNIDTTVIHSDQIADINRVYDAVIILGGIVSVRDLDTSKNLQNVIEYISECDNTHTPVLGICLGCQLIAKYLGMNIKKAQDSVYGFKNIAVNEDADMDGISRCIIQYNKLYISLHEDYIDVSDHDKVRVLASYKNYPYYIKKRSLFGLQFHPDIVEDNVKKFAKCFGMDTEDRISIRDHFNDNKKKINTASEEIFRSWLSMNDLLNVQ